MSGCSSIRSSIICRGRFPAIIDINLLTLGHLLIAFCVAAKSALSDSRTVNKIKAAIQAAYEEGQSKLKGNGKTVPPLSAIKNPLRDGDLEKPDDEAYAGCYFVNANSATAPGVVDADRQPIIERSEVYSGVYGRASINFYAFNVNGNRGIACGLNNLQKIRDV
ncbi:MAG: DUF2815 family protein [Clostridiales bacterium]|nr:DUF2815 family protein [Clostridiales bacterium]